MKQRELAETVGPRAEQGGVPALLAVHDADAHAPGDQAALRL